MKVIEALTEERRSSSSSPRKIVGIDNGLDGAIVELDLKGRLIDWHDTPVIEPTKGKGKRQYAVAEMATILRSSIGDAMVYLEYAQAMPAHVQGRKQGTQSSFVTGFGYGLWQGLLTALAIPFVIVHPKTWMSVMLRDAAGDGKARSFAVCQRLYPEIPLMKPRGRVLSMDGRADAALIAAYGVKQGGA